MKKIILSVLAVALMIAVFPVSTFAEKGNYLNNDWEKGLSSGISVKTENGEKYVSASVTNSWTSPTVDILPAMKLLVSSRKWITVTIAFDVRVTSDNNDLTFSVRPLIRALQNDSSVSDSDWNKAYKAIVGSNFALFNKSSGNIIWYLDSDITVQPNKWYHYEKTVSLTYQQINDTMTPKWNLCVDNIKNISDIKSLDFKNAQVVFDKVKGDVNCDGKLDSVDRITLSRYLLGWNVIVDETEADINGDGKINAIDRIIISRYLSGWDGYDLYFE